MFASNYNKIYTKENYRYDIETPDITNKKIETIFWDDPNEDCPTLVHEIHITDIGFDSTEYMNLSKSLGGLPRLDSKGNFTESIMNTRFQTKNGKKTMIYFCPDGTGMIRWQNCEPLLIPDALDGISESKCKVIMIISAKKLKMYNKRLETLKPTIRHIKKFGRAKYTESPDTIAIFIERVLLKLEKKINSKSLTNNDVKESIKSIRGYTKALR